MALSFTEKRALQKAITENLANLQAGSLSFADKRKYQKEIQDAFAKLKEKLDTPVKMSRVEWEMAVIRVIEDKADATTSDAQGIFDGQEFAVAQAWGLGLGPEEAAEKIIKAATVPIEPVADALAKLESIKQFFPEGEYQTIKGNLSGEEKDFFVQKIGEMANAIETMPKVYGQDGKGNDAVVYLHYFKGGSDWYITEKDSKAEQLQAFGYAILNGDKQNAELGYISIVELTKAGVELDLYWSQKTLGAVKGDGEDPALVVKKDESAQGDPDIRKMKNAVVDHGGEVLEETDYGLIAFTLHGGVGGKATLSYGDGEGYRVAYGDKGRMQTEYFKEPYDAVEAYCGQVGASEPQSQKLSDLIAGKYNNEKPEEFLRIVKEIIEEINNVDPVKPPVVEYVDANKDKAEAILESIMSEIFGKMWAADMENISRSRDKKAQNQAA